MKLKLDQAESIFSLLESSGGSTLYPIIAQLLGYKAGTPVDILALLRIKKKAELRDGKREACHEESAWTYTSLYNFLLSVNKTH